MNARDWRWLRVDYYPGGAFREITFQWWPNVLLTLATAWLAMLLGGALGTSLTFVWWLAAAVWLEAVLDVLAIYRNQRRARRVS